MRALSSNTRHKFPLVVSVLVGILVGSLSVGYVATKYAKVHALMNQQREAILQYMYVYARSIASDSKDAENENLERQARERAEKCERELKELEGFWLRYENGNWYTYSKWSFFTICVLLGLGVTGLVCLCIWPFSLSYLSFQNRPNRRYNQDTVGNRIVLPRKTAVIADSDCSLKNFPLLCLYFDNFEEIRKAWQQGSLDAARHDSDIRSCHFSLDEIMGDENLFLDLYKNKLLRLKLLDGRELRRDSEEEYLDRIVHPEKYADELSFRPDSDPQLVAMMKETRKKIDAEVEAIRLRYGMNSD